MKNLTHERLEQSLDPQLGQWPNPAEELIRLHSTTEGCHSQSQCPLFSIIPPEIRNDIFKYTLSEVESDQDAYDMDTCFRRPGYLAPHRTYTDILRTCKRIYSEAWHLPWAGSEHVFYFAWDSRKPDRTVEVHEAQDMLNTIHASQGDTKIDHVRIFAQLCNLEGGENFAEVCDMDHFHPTKMTVTIRHTDFWNWESDAPMRINGYWAACAELPDSVREINLEFESIEQRKASVDFLAEKVARQWRFTRKDARDLVADPDKVSSMRWIGSSTWGDERWIGDEIRPNELDYYVRIITFRLASPTIEKDVVQSSGCPSIQVPSDIAHRTRIEPASVHIHHMAYCNLPQDADADQIRAALVDDYEEYYSEDNDSDENYLDESEEDDEEDEENEDDDERVESTMDADPNGENPHPSHAWTNMTPEDYTDRT